MDLIHTVGCTWLTRHMVTRSLVRHRQHGWASQSRVIVRLLCDRQRGSRHPIRKLRYRSHPCDHFGHGVRYVFAQVGSMDQTYASVSPTTRLSPRIKRHSAAWLSRVQRDNMDQTCAIHSASKDFVAASRSFKLKAMCSSKAIFKLVSSTRPHRFDTWCLHHSCTSAGIV